MKQTIRQRRTNPINAFLMVARRICSRLHDILTTDVYFGRNISHVPSGTIVFFPIQDNIFLCGIAAIVSYKSKKSTPPPIRPGRICEYGRSNRTIGVRILQ